MEEPGCCHVLFHQPKSFFVHGRKGGFARISTRASVSSLRSTVGSQFAARIHRCGKGIGIHLARTADDAIGGYLNGSKRVMQYRGPAAGSVPGSFGGPDEAQEAGESRVAGGSQAMARSRWRSEVRAGR